MDKGIMPVQALRYVTRKYPKAWEQVKSFRAGKGKDLPDWPDWCYIPLAAGVAIATQKNQDYGPFYPGIDPSIITAAAAWRISKGIYRFDADLYNALVSQPLDGNIPCEALKRLPEWCVYIEIIPDKKAMESENYVVGFWAHLEKDINDGREELRFILFYNTGMMIPLSIHIGDWTLEEGLQRYIAEAKKYAERVGVVIEGDIDDTSDIEPLVQLVLYLCAENIDMPRVPSHPNTRVRRSGQVDVVRTPRTWDVGVRIGATIRKYRNEEARRAGTAQSKRESPRPHIRRAHWHHFWTGPRDGERKLILRWLPPIPVGVQEDGPVVVHIVE